MPKLRHSPIVLLSALIMTLTLQGFAQTATSPAPPLSPRQQRQMQDEIKQGDAVAAEVAKEEHLSKDKAELDRVNAIGQRLAAVVNVTRFPALFGNDSVYPFKWSFNVVEDKDVNAFSLPGGHVYVNSGLLAFVRSDDELAAVLGHEMTHSAHHHAQELARESRIMNQNWLMGMIAAALAHVDPGAIAEGGDMAQMAQQGYLNNHYSETAESDADHGGLILMKKAGYNPAAMLTFMERLRDLETRSVSIEMGILQDHPYTADRIVSIQKELNELGVTVTAADIAQVTSPYRFTVNTTAGTSTVILGDVVCAKLSDPDGKRGQRLVEALNAQMMQGLFSYNIDATGDQIILSDRPILTVTPADAALEGADTADNAAVSIQHDLQRAVYIASFDKAPTVEHDHDRSARGNVAER